MTQALLTNNIRKETYFIPLMGLELQKKSMKVARCALKILVGLGITGGAVLCFAHFAYQATPPIWTYSLVFGITVIAGTLLIGSYYLSTKEDNENQNLSTHKFSKGAVLNEDNTKWGKCIDELCEIGENENIITCSFERSKEIVNLLREKQSLFILNGVPPTIKNRFLGYHPLKYTPLHYWAMKGDL